MLLKHASLFLTLVCAKSGSEEEDWFSSLVQEDDDDLSEMFNDFDAPTAEVQAIWLTELEDAMTALTTGGVDGNAVENHEAEVGLCATTHLGDYEGGGACYAPYTDCLDGLAVPVNALKEHNATLADVEAQAAIHCARTVSDDYKKKSYCCGASCDAEDLSCPPSVLSSESKVCHTAEIQIDWLTEGVEDVRGKISTSSGDSFMAQAHGGDATLRSVIGTMVGYDAWKNESDSCNSMNAQVASLTTEKGVKEATLAAERAKCVQARQVRDSCVQAAANLLASNCQSYATCVQGHKDTFTPTLTALEASHEQAEDQFTSMLSMICLVKHCTTDICDRTTWEACLDSGDAQNGLASWEFQSFTVPTYPDTPAVCTL